MHNGLHQNIKIDVIKDLWSRSNILSNLLDEVLDKCWRNVGWKFILFVRVIQYVSSNMQVHSFFHSMSNQRWRRTCFCQWYYPIFFVISIFLSLLNLFFLFPLYNSFGLLAFSFSAISNFFCSSYSSPFCSCNLDRWSESFSLLFKLMSIWCEWIFYLYFFAERISFVESFEIRNSNIRNDVIKMKCWMKPGENKPIQHENCIGWSWKYWMKNLLQIKFSSNMIFSNFAIFAFS